MITRLFWLFSLLCYATLSKAAITQENLLAPEQAFQIHATVKDSQHIELRFIIVQGYYLYRDRIHLEANGFTLPSPALPSGEIKHDEFLGRVSIYRNSLSIPLSLPTTLPKDAFLSIRSQGCADAGVCYPPHVQKIALTALLNGKLQQKTQPSASLFNTSTSPKNPFQSSHP